MATLSGLTLSSVDFGTFASSTTSYAAEVDSSVTETTVTPTVNDSGASYVIRLGGVEDTDGTVALAAGSNVITVEVTAEDDSTTKTYTVTVTRLVTSQQNQASSDATLSGLTLSDIDFGIFSSDTDSYTASVAYSVSQTTVTPTVNDSGATHVTELGGVVDPDGVVSLSVGSNVITVWVTAEDGEFTRPYSVTVTRAAASTGDTAATGSPTINGTAQVGQVLTASTSGIADADGLTNVSYNYHWLSSRDTEIEGATSSTYTLQASDANKVIKVRVDFMDDSGYEESLTSAATAAVSPNVSATGAPAITGTVEVGETLTADTSGIVDSDGLDNVSFSYQWIHSDDTNDWYIVGATGATYAITAADVDKAIKLRVDFTDDKGSVESLTSPATAVVPVEAAFTFSIDGTTVTCDSYDVWTVNVPNKECDDPTSTDQGASEEIEVEIEVARSVNTQLYKFRVHIYQMEDSIGHVKAVEANDLCLGPGLADSVSMEVTPGDGAGNFTYTDEGTIFSLCPAGTYQLYVPWYRYNYEDEEYEYAGTFRRYFFINGDDEEATSIEQVKFITALYPDPPVSHDEVQIQGTKQSTMLNRTLTTFSLSIDGLVPDSDTDTTDYVVRVRVIGDGGPVPYCHVGNVGYSYLLKTVPEDGRWAMDAHVLGGCLRHPLPDTLQVELFDGSDLTDYSEPIVFHGSNIISYGGGSTVPRVRHARVYRGQGRLARRAVQHPRHRSAHHQRDHSGG